MELTAQDYYKALTSRDSRFDGVFFTCVASTGIYCRPICPTHAPKRENCSFVQSAAEAEKQGFRPCLRCRPELAPLIPLVNSSPAYLLRHRIEETLLIDETLSGISKLYGVSERHLRRLFIEAFGVEPKQYLTTRRLLFAKQLLQDTQLPISSIAYSAGFNTPGRLTINMRQAYSFTPERLRKESPLAPSTHLTLKVDYRPPFDWVGLLHILKGRATPMETVTESTYQRLFEGHTVIISNNPKKHRLHVRIPVELSQQAHAIVQKVRQLFDLDASPLAIQAALSEDPFMRNLIQKYPGIRVPGAWDGFELLLRVIIGQQISVAGATTIMRRLVEQIGATPQAIANSSPETIAAIGLPAKRAATLYRVGQLVKQGQIDLAERHPQTFYDQLVAVPGIGPWTAEYLQMRALHWPDAFPAGDLGVQKALAIDGKKLTEKQAALRANSWRPWRSYATMLLWRSIMNNGG